MSKVESDYYTGPPPLPHPSPHMGPLKHPEIASPFLPHQWDKVFRKKSSVIRRLQFSVFSLHPVLILSGWSGPQTERMPPHSLLKLPTLPFLPSPLSKTRYTYIFLQLIDILIINISVLWSLQRVSSLYVWSLHKWLFSQCSSWSDSRLLKVLGSRWAQGGTQRIVRRIIGKILRVFLICHWLIFVLPLMPWVVIED